MLTRIQNWLVSDSAKRVARTLIQVFGGVVIAALLDYGTDGQIVLRAYIYGNDGIIVIGAGALAFWMNRKVR